MDEKNLKFIRYLTGGIFAAMGLVSITRVITALENSGAWGWFHALSAIGALLMAASMFFAEYEILMVGAGVQALAWFIHIFPFEANSFFFSILRILFHMLLIAGYVVLAFATHRNKAACKYGLISIALLGTGYIVEYSLFANLDIFTVGSIMMEASFFHRLCSPIFSALDDIIPVAPPLILACVVLENTPQTRRIKAIKQTPDNRIEELTKLKDLLDTGVITQEEFDAKKKQLLGV